MAQYFEVRRWLTQDTLRDAQIVTCVLQQIQQLLNEDNDLGREVKYNIRRKGEKEHIRFNQIWAYVGPDNDTLALLNTNVFDWLQDPALFWRRPSPPSLAALDPQSRVVRRCSCILLLELSNKYKQLPANKIAEVLWQTGHFLDYDLKKIVDIVETMLSNASRYKNIGKFLGAAVPLVLGTSVSETIWTKALPKTGERFGSVMRHLETVGVGELALQYEALYQAVIEYQLDFFENQLRLQPPRV